MTINRTFVKEQFDRYANTYDMTDVKVRLKWEHTYYVAENCERIAGSMQLPVENVDIAWLLGMFHDIGRFEQLRRYHTFQDKNSVNHAELSADLLFREDLISQFLEDIDASEADLMEKAIRCHNRFQLPEILTERERMFACILRDADKADILRVNCQTPRTAIYDLPEEEFLYSDMTDEVYQAMANFHEVDRRYSRTGIDFIMGHVGFVYGLVYPESRRIVAEQGYLSQLLGFKSLNPETDKRLEKVREAVLTYLQE